MLLNIVVVSRGILAINCTWYGISDIILKDGTGVNLYNKYKIKYGDFAPANMFGEKLYIVTSNHNIRTILDNSPDPFGPGKLKMRFFNSFMSKNVGVSSGCPWKKRRNLNEEVLFTDNLHIYNKIYDAIVRNQITKWSNKCIIDFADFFELSKVMVAHIVFGQPSINNDIFTIFSKANSLQAFYNPNFQIDPVLYKSYIKILDDHIKNPNPISLIGLLMKHSNNREEVLHQIPHFIFPIVGLYSATVPRLLLLLINSPSSLNKVMEEVNVSSSPNELNYTRNCILETLRLNNPVITSFRTLQTDFTFSNGKTFPKGSQFLILNNPVLRESEFFTDPNKFIPERWTLDMEKSYYAISFNQGPQRCPGKDLAIFLVQSFIFNFIHQFHNKNIDTDKINISNVPQIINPCKIKFLIS